MDILDTLWARLLSQPIQRPLLLINPISTGKRTASHKTCWLGWNLSVAGWGKDNLGLFLPSITGNYIPRYPQATGSLHSSHTYFVYNKFGVGVVITILSDGLEILSFPHYTSPASGPGKE